MTKEQALYVLALISQGYTPLGACKHARVNHTEFMQLVRADEDLREKYAFATEIGLDAMVDITLTINTDPVYGTTDPAMASVLSRNIQWYASRKNPTKYGAKVMVERKITADKVILDAIASAKRRALDAARVSAVDAVELPALPAPPKPLPDTTTVRSPLDDLPRVPRPTIRQLMATDTIPFVRTEISAGGRGKSNVGDADRPLPPPSVTTLPIPALNDLSDEERADLAAIIFGE